MWQKPENWGSWGKLVRLENLLEKRLFGRGAEVLSGIARGRPTVRELLQGLFTPCEVYRASQPLSFMAISCLRLASHSSISGITDVWPLHLALYMGSEDQVFRFACMANTAGMTDVLYLYSVLRLEARASCTPGKLSSIQATHQPLHLKLFVVFRQDLTM